MTGVIEMKQGVESKVELPFEWVKVTLLDKKGDPSRDLALAGWRWLFEVEASGVEKLLVKKVRFLRRAGNDTKSLLVLDYSVARYVHLLPWFRVGEEGRLLARDPDGITVEITSFVRKEDGDR